MVRRSPRAASTWSISRARSCIARSLKASVGPWNSSIAHRLVSKLYRNAARAASELDEVNELLRKRRDRRMAEIPVGLLRHAGEVGFANGIAGE